MDHSHMDHSGMGHGDMAMPARCNMNVSFPIHLSIPYSIARVRDRNGS